MSTHDELREIALNEFASAGYAGTSLQHIADIAGLSKSSVLYHFASKEALLEAAIGPAIDRIATIIASIEDALVADEARRAFVVQFVDFLLEHRREVNMFINQASGLEDVPVVNRANEVIDRLAGFFSSSVATVEDHLRFGIALGGAAYVLSAKQDEMLEYRSSSADSLDEVRVALVTIVSELLAPVSAQGHPRAVTPTHPSPSTI